MPCHDRSPLQGSVFHSCLFCLMPVFLSRCLHDRNQDHLSNGKDQFIQATSYVCNLLSGDAHERFSHMPTSYQIELRAIGKAQQAFNRNHLCSRRQQHVQQANARLSVFQNLHFQNLLRHDLSWSTEPLIPESLLVYCGIRMTKLQSRLSKRTLLLSKT